MRKLSAFIVAVAVLSFATANVAACEKHGKGCCAKAKAKLVKDGDKTGCSATKAAKAKSGCCMKGKLTKLVKAVADSDAGAVVKDGCGARSRALAKAGCRGKAGCNPVECASKPGCGKSLAHCVPVMQYRVGETTTCCKETAKKLAGENGKMLFVVGDKTYEEHAEATKALGEILDEMTAKLLTVQMMVGEEHFLCPMGAKAKARESNQKIQFVALRQSFDSRENAEAAVAKAKQALEKVAMSYKVDGKPTHCSKTAAQCAKSGKKVEYVVDDKSTCCSIEADVLLARAKLMAVIELMEGPPGDQAASL